MESAQQCIRSFNRPEVVSSRLESWVGPTDIPAAHGIQSDVELMLILPQCSRIGQVSP